MNAYILVLFALSVSTGVMAFEKSSPKKLREAPEPQVTRPAVIRVDPALGPKGRSNMGAGPAGDRRRQDNGIMKFSNDKSEPSEGGNAQNVSSRPAPAAAAPSGPARNAKAPKEMPSNAKKEDSYDSEKEKFLNQFKK